MAASTNKTLIAVVGAAVVMVVVVGGYLVYDRTGSPCESIFQQASTRLNASLSVLRSGGEVAIGKTQIQELTERSQMVALNLKTCCIVFDGGKLDSKEFLNCKNGAKRYEARIERIGGIISTAMAANAAGQKQVVAAKALEVSQQVEAAMQTANAFEQQVTQVSAGKTAVLPSSASPAPPPAAPAAMQPAAAAAVVAGGVEAEPNNTSFEANRITAGQTITGELADKSDNDWYRLQPGSSLRDWISIKLENRSEQFFATLTVYDANKNQIGYNDGSNPGANAEVSLVVTPDAEYYLKVDARQSTSGAYALTPMLQKRHDHFEPNDDAFTAKTIEVRKVVDANIMDAGDDDWYRLSAFAGTVMKLRLDNRSTTFGPWIAVYDRNKKQLVARQADNAGQSLEFELKVNAGEDHFVQVSKRWNSSGAYRIGVTAGN